MTVPFLQSKSCADCPIRHSAVCALCEPDEFARLERMKSYRTVEAGRHIAWAGDPVEAVASVVIGCASLTRTLEDGRAQMVGLLLPSDFIGSPGRETISYDVLAETDVTLCQFRRRDFERLLDENHHVCTRLREMATDELDAARDWMLVLARKTAREKVASFLALLVRRSWSGSGPHPAEVDLPLRREAIASYIGSTIETVSRQFTALRKDRIIELHGLRHVEILDHAALLAAAGDDADGILPG